MSTTKRKDPNRYPAGWNRQRVERVIRYYDAMTDAQGAGEIESLPPVSEVTWVAVPNRLMPMVRKLLDRHKKSA
jgi:hypothetical protein